MAKPRLNLIVLRVADLDRAAAFYRLFDLEFVRHAHGSGPEHFAAEWNDIVFELYPASAEQPVTESVRIGFAVTDVDQTVARLAEVDGAKVVVAAKESPWGRRAVVADPDGHRVEVVSQTRSTD